MTDFDDWFDREVETGIRYSGNVFGSLGLPTDRMEDYLRGVIRSAFEAGRKDTIPRTEAEAMVAAAYAAAEKCADRLSDLWHSQYKDRASPHAGSSYKEGMSDGADDVAAALSKLTPADAHAVLDKMLAEAEARGERKAALAEMQHIGEQIEGAADTEARIAEAVAKERERVARTVGDFMMQEFGWVDGIERIVHDMLTAIRQTEGEG